MISNSERLVMLAACFNCRPRDICTFAVDPLSTRPRIWLITTKREFVVRSGDRGHVVRVLPSRSRMRAGG
jgi:hypothetical protein